MNTRRALACAFSSFALAACAGAPPSSSNPPPTPASSVAPPPPAEASATPIASAPVAPTPPANSADAGVVEPPAPALIPICDAKCDKLVAKCSKVSVENCRLNCGKYDPPPAGCAAQVRAALECARDAKDLACANVAPGSCAAKFREISACASGTQTHATADTSGALPDGWEHYVDSANGFQVPMPKGASDKTSGDKTAHTVTVDGTTYSVTVYPLPSEKPSEKSLLRLMMKIQGRCSDKLKLDGFIEKPGATSIHYASHCPDKTDWNGMVYIGKKNLVLLSAQAPAGKIGTTEPFFYGFEFTGS
ncbi:MAG TPA: hypothetical protein VGM44_05260 [Polyangiaceae bacterium]|jgi:hypothetical protein